MARKLKWQFILASTGAVLIVLGIVLFLINHMNYRSVNRSQFQVIEYIAEIGGEIPEGFHMEETLLETVFGDEAPYRFRYFTVWLDHEGNMTDSNTEHVYYVTEELAEEFAKKALARGRRKGSAVRGGNHYVYECFPQNEGTMCIFLDSTQEFWQLRRIRQYSLMFGLSMLLLFVSIVYAISGTVVEPVARTIESQKEFITNAGHELKTPIAVISANAEVLEMINGESEWTTSIINQVKRLSGLVNDLVLMAKMDEETRPELTKMDMSAAVKEAELAFRTVVEQAGKTMKSEIEPEVFVMATDRELPALVNNLLDNAVKYCDDGGEVQVVLKKKGRETGAVLTVTNSYAEGASVDTQKFFDRFYREDESHSQKKSGYGIGLSMVRSIVRAYRGRVTAQWKDGIMSFTVTLN